MVRMPLNNKARQQLRNLYALMQASKKPRTISVKRVNNNNKSMNKKLSPRRRVTKSGRPYSVWSEATSKSGKTYSIQTVRPNSRKVWNIV